MRFSLKVIIGVLLMLFCNVSFTQNCGTTFYDEEVNCIDADGKKQGLWLYFTRNVPDHKRGEKVKYLKLKGHYKNDGKIGEWKEYDSQNYYFGADKVLHYTDSGRLFKKINYYSGVTRTSLYKGDSIFKITEVDDSYYYEILLAENSVSIKGHLFRTIHKNIPAQKIIVQCNSDSCSFYIPNKGLIDKFSFIDHKNFEFRFSHLSFGSYDIKIRNLLSKTYND